MTVDANIKLSINAGDGISQAIDRQLDKELGVDVKLGLKDWNCVFDIVKADKATQEKQYSGPDNDITKNNNYVVQQGVYELTKNAWSQILQIAKQKMGITGGGNDSGEIEAVALETEEDSAADTDSEGLTDEEQLTKLLSDAGLDYSEMNAGLQKDLLRKFRVMTYYAEANGQVLDDETVQQRLSNYVKGWNFHKFESDVILDPKQAEDYQSDCSKATNTDELKNAYNQFGKEYVEFYDNDGDGKINPYEMFNQELAEHYISKGMTQKEALTKAGKVVAEYRSNGYSVDNLPANVDTDEMELFTLVLTKMGVLDQDNDGILAHQETGAYLFSMAQAQDGKNNITPKEYWVVADAIMDEEKTPKLQKYIETYYDFLN